MTSLRTFQMSNGFSGVIRISNISDFIEPSQKCVIPLNSKPIAQDEEKLVGIHAKSSMPSSRIGVARPNNSADKKIQVSLSDCLACSGCVTTAETMLIGSQTTDQMLTGLSNHQLSVVTISPQSLCSLAVHFQLSPQVMAIQLSSYFKSLGAKYVVDSSFGRLLSRKLCYEEFRERTAGNSATLFAGACPGFVCYAEKTHGDLLVPLISKVRSPQAVMGALVKNYLAKKLNVAPSQTYHVTVMPCYDKKLEASRKDFTSEEDVKEVDCVITAIELQPLLEQYFANFSGQHSCPSVNTLSQDLDWLNRMEQGKC
uniref:Iron hydrogenase large subunit C-terminal domain-containing protein n=1 Tax=Ditylenchus dipsaci TaxID=166011 RepID=A0A915DIT3_9BILA